MSDQLDWLKSSGEESGDINVQGSTAWRKWRGKGLGSSDAPILLGWSPWKPIDQLLMEKKGLWKQEFGAFQQRAMDRGKALEPVIREWYEKSHYSEGTKFPDAVSTHSQHEFMRASFDGVNRQVKNEDGSTGRLIEIKAPNMKDHEGAKLGVVPEKYIPQCQWLMMIGNIPWCDYVSYGSDDTYAVVPMKADPIMHAELMRRAVVFWSFVQNPGSLSTMDPTPWVRPVQELNLDLPDESPAIAEQEIEVIVAHALVAQAEMKASTGRFEALKEVLKSRLGDQKKLICGEAVMEWQERKGAVDYAKVPQLQGVDLEPYRKAPTRAFLFDRVK